LVVALSLNQSMTAKADERRQLLAAIVDAVAKSR
jgi:hypothetical protein